MNKSQFIEIVQKSGNYKTKAEAEAAVVAFTTAITTALTAKEEVSLVGFGSFKSSLLRGKSGTVPGTLKTYNTADKFVPKFKAGKGLLTAVSEVK